MRRVMITGGVKRIGLAITKKLARDGWHVIAHYNKSQPEANDLMDWAKHEDVVVDCIQADLSLLDQIETLVPACVARFGALSCLINNASQFELDSIETVNFASFESHFTINLYAAAILSRHFFETAAPDDPVIINLLDQKIENLNPDFLSYTLSKSGLYALTKMLAMKWAGKVRVCGIAPGLALISGKQTPEGFERAWQAAPMGRGTTPEELADTAAFLLGMRGITGEVIFVDGGERLGRRPRDVAFDIAKTPD